MRVSKRLRFEELNKRSFFGHFKEHILMIYLQQSSQKWVFQTANWVRKNKDLRVLSEANVIFKVAEEL